MLAAPAGKAKVWPSPGAGSTRTASDANRGTTNSWRSTSRVMSHSSATSNVSPTQTGRSGRSMRTIMSLVTSIGRAVNAAARLVAAFAPWATVSGGTS